MTLCRTSFSPNIKERLDYSCAIYDAAGDTIAQGDHMPVHLGAMPLSVRAAIDHAPMQDGDVVVLNDPFRGGTHLPDLTMVSPVFLGRGRRPAFYVANRAHHSDVGGMSPGSMPLAREIYQEGLIIPPVKLVRRGAIVDDVLAMILANVRTPDEREGDLTAQIAANRVAGAAPARDRRDPRRAHGGRICRRRAGPHRAGAAGDDRADPGRRLRVRGSSRRRRLRTRPDRDPRPGAHRRRRRDRRLHRLRSADDRRRQRELRDHALGHALRVPLPGPRGRALQRRHRPRRPGDRAGRHHRQRRPPVGGGRRQRRNVAAHHRRRASAPWRRRCRHGCRPPARAR